MSKKPLPSVDDLFADFPTVTPPAPEPAPVADPAPAPTPKKAVVLPSADDAFADFDLTPPPPKPLRPVPTTPTLPVKEMGEHDWKTLRRAVEAGPNGGAVRTPSSNQRAIERDGWIVPAEGERRWHFVTPRDNNPEYDDPEIWEAVIGACAEIIPTISEGVDTLDDMRDSYIDKYRWDDAGKVRRSPSGQHWGAEIVDLATKRMDGILIKKTDRGWSLLPNGKDRLTTEQQRERAAKKATGAVEPDLTSPTASPTASPQPAAEVVDETELLKQIASTSDLSLEVQAKILEGLGYVFKDMSKPSVRYSVQRHDGCPTVESVALRLIEVMYEITPRHESYRYFHNNRVSKPQKPLVKPALELLVEKKVVAKDSAGAFFLVDPTRFDPNLTYDELSARAAEKKTGVFDKAAEAVKDSDVMEKARRLFKKEFADD